MLRRCPIRLQLPTQFFETLNSASGEVNHLLFLLVAYWRTIIAFGMAATVGSPRLARGCGLAVVHSRRRKHLERLATEIRSLMRAPSFSQCFTSRRRSRLFSRITDYILDLKARKVNADRFKTSKSYFEQDSAGCGFKYLRDLSADNLRRHLRSQTGMSAATYNWHAGLWVAFGWWLTGRRIEGKRQSQTGNRRLLSIPFEGFGRVDENADRWRMR